MSTTFSPLLPFPLKSVLGHQPKAYPSGVGPSGVGPSGVGPSGIDRVKFEIQLPERQALQWCETMNSILPDLAKPLLGDGDAIYVDIDLHKLALELRDPKQQFSASETQYLKVLQSALLVSLPEKVKEQKTR